MSDLQEGSLVEERIHCSGPSLGLSTHLSKKETVLTWFCIRTS